MTGAIDVHQHLWPDELVELLRARSHPPRLEGWTLHLEGEPPYDVDPAAQDAQARAALDRDAGVLGACVSLSAPLGLESLEGADHVLAAWHRGVSDLPDHFAGWASVATREPDLDGLEKLLARPRFVGVQLAATQLLTPAGWEQVGPVLAVVQAAGKPVLVHPGPARAVAGTPSWWAPVVDYSAQLQAAWWGWHAAGGRADFPGLRLLFAAGAGLAPLLTERHGLRGGDRTAVDPDVFVDTSGHGTRALESLVRVLGIDVLALGSDRPYALPLTHLLGDAATHAVRVVNPRRLLAGVVPTPHQEGTRPWTSPSLPTTRAS